MPKVNLWGLREIPRQAERKVFVDPLQPGVEIAVTLRAQTVPEATLARRRGEEYVEMYTAGGRSFITPVGEPMALPEDFIVSTAMLEAMQCPEDEEERYTFPELVAMALRAPAAFNAVSEWAGSLQVEAGLGKVEGVELKPSSEPPSGSTSFTPNGCNSSPEPSGVSMSASGRSSHATAKARAAAASRRP